jgi:hypothetical protein
VAPNRTTRNDGVAPLPSSPSPAPTCSNAKLKYRRHDAALAILGDYHGPGHVAVRSGDVVKIKNHPTPLGHDPEENYP